MKKRLLIGCCLMAAAIATASAQSSTKSPYSQFGIGILTDRSQGMSRGMNGVGTALQQSDQVNTLNPASYGNVDSLTMLFDASVTGQLTNFKEGSTKQYANTANFDYIVASFRAWRNVGVAVGVLPLSNVGYSYSTNKVINNEVGKLTEAYSGEGGLHEAFIGFGWHPVKPLFVGFNAGYVWGDIDRTVLSSNSNFSSLMKEYTATVKSYKLDAGLQMRLPMGKNDVMTLGATMGVGHKLGCDATLHSIDVGQADTTTFVAENALELPWSWSAGLAWRHRNSLTLAADVSMQQWGKTGFPKFENDSYLVCKDELSNSMALKVGAEWVPAADDMNHYLNRVHYRLGAGLTTPYYKIKGEDGPRDISVSLGLGLPIQNRHNSRSTVNISGQWVHSSAKDFITENMFRINIGITFNERWFAKWKVE